MCNLRHFAVINEHGKMVLTWGKKEDAATMSKSEQRFRVDQIKILWNGEVSEDGSVWPSFQCQLGKDIGIYVAKGVKAAKSAAKLEAKAAKKTAKASKKKGGEPEPETGYAEEQNAAQGGDAEEGEPPDDGDEDETTATSVEISAHKSDIEGRNICRFVEAMIAAGATVTGGASTETTAEHGLTVLQDGEKDGKHNIEFKLNDNSCVTDFKGSLLSAKGITTGLKLSKINDVEVLGW
jgi:hypothetical protein